MVKKGEIKKILLMLLIVLTMLELSCKKESSEGAAWETKPEPEAELDIQKISRLTGVPFTLLKSETIGYAPLHKFYWIGLQEEASDQKVEELADAIIKETIAKHPKTFHSFTIHFFREDEIRETLEESKCFARATFLPEGNWQKVGRVPIDDYKSYKLTCTFLEQET